MAVPRSRTSAVVVNTLGVLVTAVMAFPVYWMVATAFKPSGDILSYHVQLFPWPITFQHFTDAVSKPHFLTYMRNSLVVALGTVLLATAVAVLAALAVARLSWHGRKAYVLLVLIVQTAPFEALMIPIFIIYRDLGLLNRLPALVITYFVFALPFTIWTLRGFVAAIPVELEEAAMVDGCSRVGAYLRVVFPLLWPGLVATGIFAFIAAWNEFLFALIIMQDDTKYTLPIWLSTFRTAFGTDWGGTMAASTLFTLPVLVFFLVVQRKLVSGLSAGAVKG
jgi:N,N'-diacetylchitobiose transport system permease protein